MKLAVGQRVRYGQCAGVIKFIGKTSFAPGQWIGVQLDDDCGRHNGPVLGVRYFSARPGCGIFIKPENVLLDVPLTTQPPLLVSDEVAPEKDAEPDEKVLFPEVQVIPKIALDVPLTNQPPLLVSDEVQPEKDAEPDEKVLFPEVQLLAVPLTTQPPLVVPVEAPPEKDEQPDEKVLFPEDPVIPKIALDVPVAGLGDAHHITFGLYAGSAVPLERIVGAYELLSQTRVLVSKAVEVEVKRYGRLPAAQLTLSRKHLPNEPCHDSYVCRNYRLCDWDGSDVAIDRSCGACIWQRAIEWKIVDQTAVEEMKKGAQGKKHRRSLPVDPLKVKPKRRQLKKRAG
ncbi:unnamed protein product, partial [Mesorhabditis spiculigera]